MTGETSGPSAQDIRMASFEEKFNDLLNFVRLLVKRDTESEKQVEDINKDTSEDNTGGHSHTNLGPPPVQPSKPEERDFQLDAKVEKTMRSTKMVDASALLALAKPDVENEARTVDPNVAPRERPISKRELEHPLKALSLYKCMDNGEENVMNKKEDDHSDIRNGHSSKGSKESEKEAQSPISKKEEPKEVDHHMIPHKRTHTQECDDRKAIRDLASHSTIGQASTKSLSKRETERHRRQGTLMLHTGRYQSSRNLSSSAKLKSEPRKFCTLPMPMDELYPRLLEKRLISPVFLKQSPHLLHDSSKKCEFHFGRPGHSLEDCHALKNKVQDLVDHGILRINEGSTPSVIIAWPPERRKDETVIPSPQSQGPYYLWHSASSFDHATNTLRGESRIPHQQMRDTQTEDTLGHSEPDVPFMVQARKPSMHTVPMKKARSTLGFRANEPSRDQTERTISKEHRSLDPASPRMNSQDLDITTTEEEEVPENWKEISHHRHTQQTWRSILRQISRSLKIYIIQANGHLLQNLPNRPSVYPWVSPLISVVPHWGNFSANGKIRRQTRGSRKCYHHQELVERAEGSTKSGSKIEKVSSDRMIKSIQTDRPDELMTRSMLSALRRPEKLRSNRGMSHD
uniref:Uncharacterized protein n=1 Tax=Fagus sylvatica TaxID=28930 RepID=A0A2N9FGZ6_FAGSY